MPSWPRWHDVETVVTLTTERPASRTAAERATAGSGSCTGVIGSGTRPPKTCGKPWLDRNPRKPAKISPVCSGTRVLTTRSTLESDIALERVGLPAVRRAPPMNHTMRVAASVTTTAPSTASTRRSEDCPTRRRIDPPTSPPRNCPSQPKAITAPSRMMTRVRVSCPVGPHRSSSAGICHTASSAKTKNPTSEKTLWMSPWR